LAEDEVREALAALNPLWEQLFPAEQARVVHLLVERVDIGADGLKLRFRDKGLAQMVTEVGMIAGRGRKEAA
jgi:site-specific DNA recombinase